MPKPRSARERAELLNEYGHRLGARGEDERALSFYAQAAQADPAWAAPWFNIGLLHKYFGDWTQSLIANREALARDAGHQGACWNLGIAATALRDWRSAREAWQRYGLPIEPGEEPLEVDCGLAPVRLDPDGRGEVVWCDRLDPARARIRNVPLPDSGHRYADIVLNDGAPNGSRRIGEREYPVFDQLELWQASPYATFEAWIETPDPASLAALAQRAHRDHGQAQDWTDSVRHLCRACSLGDADADAAHDHPPLQASGDAAGARWVGVAARDEAAARAVVDDWLHAHPSARLLQWRLAVPAGAAD